MVLLGRERYESEWKGPCGRVRKDKIFPIVDLYQVEKEFKKSALKMVEEYGETNYLGENDTWSLEYFKGSPEQNDREDGPSVLLLELEGDNKWHFYKKGTHQFAVKNKKELKEKWA